MEKHLSIDPPPHDGINIWMISTARKCQIAGLAAWEAEKRIMEFNGSARRPFKTNEVKRAVEKSYNTTLAPSSFVPHVEKPKWKPMRTDQTFRPRLKTVAPVDLWETSPDRLDGGISQKMILDWLFPDPNGLVCIGKSTYEFHTARLNQFKDLSACQFIVPCYMTKKKGITQDGKESMHCLDNCGPRRFCVCDFDEPRSSDHPSIIWHLKKTFDLVMALSSGGKSLHAWFSVDEKDEDGFWKAAIASGADPALMRNRSSFVRLPMGQRDNGKRQGVLYFDQSKIKEGNQ